jgi:hypothetical protein
MKKNIFLVVSLFIAGVLILGYTGCKDEEEDFVLSSLLADGIDLNGAVSPSNISPNPTITATFSVNVDAATVSAATITLVRDYDLADITLGLTVAGKVITIVPSEDLGNGALYKLSFNAGIKSSDGQDLLPFERTFTTEGNFVPAGAIAYWNFDQNANEVINDVAPAAEISIAYPDSYKATAGKAASFNGTTSIIEYANGDLLMETNDFTLSFWVKAENVGHGHFIIGLAAFYGFQFELFGGFNGFKMPVQFEFADGTSGTGGDLTYNGDGLTKDNGGWRGTVVNKFDDALPEVLENKWFHITYTYDSESKERSFYLNGELVVMQDHDLWIDDLGEPWPETGIVGLKYGGTEPETYPELTFGFIQSRAGTLWDNEPWGGYDFPDANHFKGLLDDVRIFHKALTAQEIDLMYNSEKP